MEAVASCLETDKASVFCLCFFFFVCFLIWKTPTKLIIQHNCVDERPADVFFRRVLALLTPFLANYFWSRWQHFERLQICEKMVRVWVQHHTVFWEVPQKHIDTLTNMGLSALRLRPKHYSVHLHSSSHGSQSLTLKGRSRTIYWSTVIWWRLSHSNLPEIPNSIHSTLQLKTLSPIAIHLTYTLGVSWW